MWKVEQVLEEVNAFSDKINEAGALQCKKKKKSIYQDSRIYKSKRT